MTAKPNHIAENFTRLLALVYNKMSKPSGKNSSVPKQANLTHLQLHILDELSHAPDGVTMTRLANQISISKQQLTPLIKKLEELAYVVRIQNPHDRRSFKLLLTEKGKETATSRWQEFHHLFSKKISALDEEDILDLDFAISKIIRIIEKIQT